VTELKKHLKKQKKIQQTAKDAEAEVETTESSITIGPATTIEVEPTTTIEVEPTTTIEVEPTTTIQVEPTTTIEVEPMTTITMEVEEEEDIMIID